MQKEGVHLMTPEEAIHYIEHYGWSTTRLGLERTRELLRLLGDPQKQLKFIHVAGSNGKGSTCAMLDAVLRQAGYRCGLYTSPYIEEFCERIRVDGKNIPGERLAQITARVMDLAETMEDHPSQFELVTAIAMVYFLEEDCDLVVLEVGMGGELDSTNVIDAPELACITNIGLEHTEYLGDTLEQIARTKAGILKTGSRCVCYDGEPEVTAVIRDTCRERGIPFTYVDYSRLQFVSENLDGQTFLWKEQADRSEGIQIQFRLSLLGKHQLHNAALVLTGLETLRTAGWSIPEEAVRKGLEQVRWPARLEVLQKDPLVILDGGHNPQCAQALTDSLDRLLSHEKAVFLVGVLRDKDYDSIINRMLPYARAFVCVTPASERALPGDQLAAHIRNKGMAALACEDMEAGIRKALEQTEGQSALVIFGSLYLAGAVRKAFPSAARTVLRQTGIRARNRLTAEERQAFSDRISEKILASRVYQEAETIMVYRSVKGEVNLDTLIRRAGEDGKHLAFPRCMDKEHLTAWIPEDETCFVPGPFGILEPDVNRSRRAEPEEMDLVICPGTVFDREANRMGMGGGYYDRYLLACSNARVIGVAFEAQIVPRIPTQTWDRPMDAVYTERHCYQ